MINYENHLWPLIYDQFNHGRHEQELEFYRRVLKNRTGKVLEIACGTGMIFLKLLSEGIDIYGRDISEPMLDILKRPMLWDWL
ncbi:MAG: class I SAM-dependent methyltransferase [Firmicutes bacterium]|nr:class I SAM-dependent methyltransferase [Bacillota bacterium]